LQKRLRTIGGQLLYYRTLFQRKLGGDIDSLLAGNPKVPFSEPSLSTPAPSLQGVPSIAFPLAGGASGSQSSFFVYEDSLFWPSIAESFSYP
jgi:hypothetical protein